MWFELIDETEPSASVRWTPDDALTKEPVATVFEDRRYVLRIREYAPGCEYSFWIGDERMELEPRMYSSEIEFPKEVYFESAFGPTDLKVLFGDAAGTRPNSAAVRLYVIPSKIGEENYRCMIDDLQKICHALIVDLVGKSYRSEEWRTSWETQAFRTHEVELSSVVRAVRSLMPILTAIKRSPVGVIKILRQYGPVGRCRSRRGLSEMMKKGVSPAHGSVANKCWQERRTESFDLPEHRLLKSFLSLLQKRVAECREGIRRERQGLLRDKRFRERTSRPDELSLFEKEDVPRIRRLTAAQVLADDVSGQIALELADDFWLGIRGQLFRPSNSQFSGNGHYLQAANLILRYFRDSCHWTGTANSDLMAKKGSVLYEQWVLVQVVSAFMACGLDLDDWKATVRGGLDRQYGLNFERNMTFRAKLDGDHSIVIRYQPWILPRAAARKIPGETLCHLGGEDVYWSPDIVVELRENSGRVVYALAIDAKYSRKPEKDMRDSVLKYRKIRSTDGTRGRQVLPQTWLAYPGALDAEDRISVEEDGISFSPVRGCVYDEDGSAVDASDVVFGNIVACPRMFTEQSSSQASIPVVPMPLFVDFAQGCIEYFRSLGS